MRYFNYVSTAANTPQNGACNFSAKLVFKNSKAQTSRWALVWSLILSFAVLTMTTNSYAQTKISAKVPLTQDKVHAVEEPILRLKKQLTYGQVLDLDKLPDAVTWVISGPSATVAGRGNALNDIKRSILKNKYVFKLFGTLRGLIVLLPRGGVQRSTIDTDVLPLLTYISLATTDAIGTTITGGSVDVTGTWASNILTISGTPTVPASNTNTVAVSGSASAAVTAVCCVSETTSNQLSR